MTEHTHRPRRDHLPRPRCTTPLLALGLGVVSWLLIGLAVWAVVRWM